MFFTAFLLSLLFTKERDREQFATIALYKRAIVTQFAPAHTLFESESHVRSLAHIKQAIRSKNQRADSQPYLLVITPCRVARFINSVFYIPVRTLLDLLILPT